MIVALLLLTGILLALIQTCIPMMTTVLYGCDILLPFLVYITLYSSFRSAVGMALALGVLMDALHGGVFGVYITTYVWLVIFVHWFQKVMPTNQLVWVLVCSLAMLLETVLWWLVFWLKPGLILPDLQMKQIVIPMISMFVIAPISFLLYTRIRVLYETHFFVNRNSLSHKRLS